MITLDFVWSFSMIRNLFILILIVILAALGAAAALRIILWSLRMIFNLALVIAACGVCRQGKGTGDARP